MTMAGDGTRALLVLGFESTDHPVDEAMSRALAICAEHGGQVPADERGGAAASGGEDAVGSWRDAFLGAPYVRDVLVAMGVLAETFETAITWERFAAFHERVKAAGEQALRRAVRRGRARDGALHARLPDGPAVYFTVIAPARRGEEVEQWAQIKRGGVRGDPRRGRHDHPPPRRRARSSPVV